MFENVSKPEEREKACRCPCCLYKTLHGRAGYEICKVCFWEDAAKMISSERGAGWHSGEAYYANWVGSLTYNTTSPPTGLLGIGLGGDSTPRMIAFQSSLEF